MLTNNNHTLIRYAFRFFFAVFVIVNLFSASCLAGMWEDPPVENVPPLTDELIEKIDARPVPDAGLKKLPNGSVGLYINGMHYPFVFGATPLADSMDSWHVKTWADTGHELVHVFANIGFYDPRRGYGDYHTPFWSDRDTYNEQMVETLLWRILRVHPQAKILLTLQIDVYPDWHIENPQELMRNQNNDCFVVGHHFRRIGSDPDRSKQEVLAPSFFSEKLVADESRAVERFINKLESTVPGKAVIGYVIGGHQDLQNYMWHPPNGIRAVDPNAWGDYSIPARRAFKNWARDKYRSIVTLNEAWKTDYKSFVDVTPPEAESLIGGFRYHDPETEQRAVDFKFFLTQGRSSYILKLARVVRKASSRNIIIGAYSGESGCRSDVVDNHRMLTDPDMDFLFHQPFYGDRLPPSPSGISAVLGSHQLNGKLFICDMDHHTWLGRPLGKLVAGKGVSQNDRMVGRAHNIQQLRAMWRREIGRLAVNGLGWHYHPLHGAHMFEADSIDEELITIRKWVESVKTPSPLNPVSQVAVIFDEKSIPYLRSGLSRLHWNWWHTQVEQLNSSGVPYMAYYADDLRQGKIPPAKLYIFINQLNLDKEMSAAVEKLKARGRTLVFKQDAGFVQHSRGEMGRVSKVIGMDMRLIETAETSPANTALETDHPLAGAIKNVLAQGISPAEEGFLPVEKGLTINDPDAAALANYQGTDIPALAVKDHGTWKSVFAGTDLLTAGLFHALAEYAGAWVIAPTGYAVASSDNVLMIHPLESGKVEIELDRPAKLKPLGDRVLNIQSKKKHILDLEKGNTYIFDLVRD